MPAQITDLLANDLAQRIGWALVHFIWQGLAIALLLAVALRLLRRHSSQLRWAVSCAALALMAVLPPVTAYLVTIDTSGILEIADTPDNLLIAQETAANLDPPVFLPTETTPVPLPTPALDQSEVVTAASSPGWRIEEFFQPALPWIFLAWLTGVICMSLWHIGGWLHLRRIALHGAVPAEQPIRAIFERLLQKLRISRTVKLMQSASAAVPGVIGWLRPIILLPITGLTGLTPEQIEAILAHELAHVRRHDCLVRSIQAIIETFLFYHPAVWWVSARIRQESEHCCDETAIALCGNRHHYARALAHVAQLGSRKHPLPIAATSGKLLPRIRRIIGLNEQRETTSSKYLAGIITIALLACAIAVGASKMTIEKSGNAAQQESGKAASVVLFAPDVNRHYRDTLVELLKEPTANITVTIANNIKDAIASPADIMILLLYGTSSATKPSPHVAKLVENDNIIEALKARKVIGMGYGSAQIFGEMGLEIKAGRCGHNPTRKMRLLVQEGPLNGRMSGKKIIATNRRKTDPDILSHSSLFIPAKSRLANIVEVLACQVDNHSNYASIARQGNHIFIGLTPPPQTWTPQYRRLLQTIVSNFAARPLEPFQIVRWELTSPGTYPFGLAEGFSTQELSGRTFHFRFTKPTKFSARLKHSGSRGMMIMLRPEAVRLRTVKDPPELRRLARHIIRKDAKHGEPLTIQIDITAEDIQAAGDNYWTLRVTNFDRNHTHRAKCVLNIDYDPAAMPSSPDYSAMLKLTSTGDGLRLPTPEEIKQLGPLWPTMPPQQNAAFYFAKATSLIASRELIPGGSLSAGRKEEYTGNRQQFETWIQANAAALQTMRKGLQKDGCQYPVFINKENGHPVPDLSLLAGIRHLARTVCDAGFVEELKSNQAAAVEWYLDCLRMGTMTRRNAILIQSLVGIAISSIAEKQLARIVAAGALPTRNLQKIIEQSRESEATSEQIAKTWASEATLVKLLLSPESPLRAKTEKYHTAVRQTIANNSLEQLLRPKIREKLTEEFGDREGVPMFISLAQKHGTLNVRLRILQIRAAIALHEKQHGAPPDALSALVPHFLPKVPTDPFSGKPMRYTRTKKGWKVWSVGRDNADNGGVSNATPEARHKSLDFWQGPDYVFFSDVASNVEFRSRGKIKQLPKVKGNPAETKFKTQFGPVIERVVNHKDKNCLIDFDRGKLFDGTLPEDVIDQGGKAINKWVAEQGIDAGGGMQPEIMGLIGFDLIAFPVRNDSWTQTTPQSLLATSENVFKFSKPGNPVFLSAKGGVPATWLFQTREGGIGILQILSFTDKPKAVKIRYKLIVRNIIITEPPNKIEAALDGKIGSFSFDETSLPDVIAFIRSLPAFKKINFVLDPTPQPGNIFITLTMKNVSLRSALNAMLRPSGLDYAVWNEAIFISTPERIRELTKPTAPTPAPAKKSGAAGKSSNPFTATLPDGTTVELVAISYHPSKRKQWWKPDGTLIKNRTWRIGKTRKVSARNSTVRQFIFRWNGPGEVVTQGFDIFQGNKKLPRWRGMIEAYSAKIGDIGGHSVGIATGDYQTWPGRSGTTKYGNFKMDTVFSRRGDAAVSFRTDFGSKCYIRLRAKLKQGGYRFSKYVQDRASHKAGKTLHVFENTSPKDIARVEFQTRSAYWVYFKNIAFTPGIKTQVKISTRQPELSRFAGTNAKFGPTIERVVNDEKAGTNIFIDFDTGKLFSPLPEFKLKASQESYFRPIGHKQKLDPEFLRWIRENGIDAVACVKRKDKGLRGFNVTAGRLGPKRDFWTTISPIELDSRIKLAESMFKMRAVETPPEDMAKLIFYEFCKSGNRSQSDFFTFKTREGGMGILQILSFTDKPKAVKIRYKMVQQEETGSVALTAKKALERRLLSTIVEKLSRYNIRYSYISVMAYPDLSSVKVNVANPRELRETDGKNTEVPIRGKLHLQHTNTGKWRVQGRGDLEHIEFTIPQTPMAKMPPPILQFRLVDDSREKKGEPLKDVKSGETLHIMPKILLSEADIASASIVERADNGRRSLRLVFTPDGSRKFVKITEQNRGRRLAIVHKGSVLFAPVIRASINSPIVTIEGSGNDAALKRLAKLLNTQSSKANATVDKTAETKLKTQFGPVIERVVPDDRFIDFDSNTVILPPTNLVEGVESMMKWAPSKGVDAITESGGGAPGMGCFDMIVEPVANMQWTVPAKYVLKNKTLTKGKPGNPVFMTAKGDLPATWVFKTREGGMGILQILGFTDKPKGVKIRYKRVILQIINTEKPTPQSPK